MLKGFYDVPVRGTVNLDKTHMELMVGSDFKLSGGDSIMFNLLIGGEWMGS